MGLLDKAFSLPTLGGATVSDSLVNYTVADTSTILNESFAAVNAKYGGVDAFSALGVAAPSFAALGLSTSPTSVEATASQINAEGGSSPTAESTNHIVKLVQADDDAFLVEFTIMPEVTEDRTAEYEPLSATQMPGEFQKYKGTKATSWQINGKLVCRTRDEANLNLHYVNTLRAWTMPFFGHNQASNLGAPPPVLWFSGYRSLVGRVPVVMLSANWVWPSDCDWIPTGERSADGEEIPFPTVMNVSIRLVESFAATEFNEFDLENFRNGDMVNGWGLQHNASGSSNTNASQTRSTDATSVGSLLPSEVSEAQSIAPFIKRVTDLG